MKLYAVVLTKDVFEGSYGVDDEYYLVGVYDTEEKAKEVVESYPAEITTYAEVITVELNKTEELFIGGTSYIE